MMQLRPVYLKTCLISEICICIYTLPFVSHESPCCSKEKTKIIDRNPLIKIKLPQPKIYYWFPTQKSFLLGHTISSAVQVSIWVQLIQVSQSQNIASRTCFVGVQVCRTVLNARWLKFSVTLTAGRLGSIRALSQSVSTNCATCRYWKNLQLSYWLSPR